MAWLWSSWQEYVETIAPTSMTHRGVYGHTIRASWFENEKELFESVSDMNKALQSLYDLGFTGSDHKAPPDNQEAQNELRSLVIELVHAGEELLLYHRRLAVSEAAYGFLHSHDILEHWERYLDTGRIPREVDQLVKDAHELLKGYQDMVEEDDHLLLTGLNLPSDLEAEFRLARNLFSVGFDDIAVLIAGRGLEGVLRVIAHKRKIAIAIKSHLIPGKEADTNDLIEAMYRIRWRSTRSRLISSETRALLHYLRAMRNEGAHANTRLRKHIISPREIATVIAETASSLWNEIMETRARIEITKVDKTW